MLDSQGSDVSNDISPDPVFAAAIDEEMGRESLGDEKSR